MNWFLPKAFQDNVTYDPETILNKIVSEFDSSYANYYKSNVPERGPKFNSHNHHAFHTGVPCARIFRKGEPIYRCLTCGYDDTCALCSHCFQPEFHADHNIHISICSRENGGVCDCGDPEAWINEFYCPYAEKDADTFQFTDALLPDELLESFLETVSTLLDYVIDVMTHSDLQFFNSKDLSKEFIEFYSENSNLEPSKYGINEHEDITDLNSEEYCLLLYNDQNRHYREAIQRVHLASRKVKEFAIMVTDKADTYGKAVVISSNNIDLLQERQSILAATGIATSIRSKRDVFREDMCDEILSWINDLTESEMFKLSTPVKNLFCIAFCRRWQKGLVNDPKLDKMLLYNTGCLDFFNQIPKVPSSKSDADRLPASLHWKFEPKKWNIDQELCEQCDYNLTIDDYDPYKSHLGSRFQYMVYFDIRFWKSIRFILHDMYSTSLIVNLKYKNVISSQYVDIYPTITDIYLLKDREAELNVMSTLSTQLFTCPSNSTSIVEHGDLARIFASIYGFFTDNQIKSPQNVEVTHEISMKSLRNRRWGQIFFDIGYILSRSRYSEVILSPEIVSMACDILALFQGRPVLKRESKNHVEFENPEYSSFFQSVLVIYQFAESTAHCLNNLKKVPDEKIKNLSKQSIGYVCKFLLNLETNNYPGLNDDNIDIPLIPPALDMESKDGLAVVKFSMDSGKVSFLHPIHSFFSWLLESSNFQSIEHVKEILNNSTEKYLQGKPANFFDTTLVEYSLRTIVLMSQVKSGFWVRNGYGIRSQLQLYKNTSLRESGYMRDLFMVQLFSNIYNPNPVCFVILKRWLLLDGWIPEFTESDIHNNVTPQQKIQELIDKRHGDLGEGSALAYDMKTLSYMLEECMNFFIHLLTEDLYLRALPDDAIGRIRVETEIIQNLCFGPMSYTKLCGQIPDHIVAEKRFDIILEELTIFTPPNNSKDFGSYRLKDSYFNRVNPYYFNYSANTRDDAIKLVKAKACYHKNIKPEDFVIDPVFRDANDLGIYKYVGNFSVSSYFTDFIATALVYIEVLGIEKTESLLEVLLHLVHICSFENRVDVEKHGTFFDVFVDSSKSSRLPKTSIVQMLYKMLSNDAYKVHHTKIRAIFQKFGDKHDLQSVLEQQVGLVDILKIKGDLEVESLENETERKKRIAKSKQAKLLAKFKKQQNLFLKKNDMSNIETDDAEMMDQDDEGWFFPDSHCILCQDELNDSPFGIVSYASKSSEFWTVPFDDQYWFLRSFSDNCNLDEDEIDEGENVFSKGWINYMRKVKEENVIGPGFTSRESVNRKLVALSCGHGMHFNCYLNFLNNNRNKLNQITRNTPENIEHREFLCPLCKAINNLFIPILWKSNKRQLSKLLNNEHNTNLDIYNSLQQYHLSKNSWLPQFKQAVCQDLETFSILTPQSRDIILSSNELSLLTLNQHTFKTMLSHLCQNMQIFFFPNTFKVHTSELLINTIKSTEISLRGESSNDTLVTEQLTNISLINLRSLAEFRNTLMYLSVKYSEESANGVYVRLISHLQAIHLMHKFNKTIKEGDLLELLVNTIPLPSAGFLFNIILRATFMAHVIQNIYLLVKNIVAHNFYEGADYLFLDLPSVSVIDQEKAESTQKLFKCVKEYLFADRDELMIVNDPRFGYVFYSMLVKTCTPFLRRSAIYAYLLCADTSNTSKMNNEIYLEADRLCKFLNIDSIFELICKFGNNTVPSFEYTKFHEFFETADAQPINDNLLYQLEYPGYIRLIDLPERLDFFFTKYYYSDKYDKPHMTIEDPAICLFCAEVMDIQRCAIGSTFGQCTTHVNKECANNVGIFLLPKDKTLLLLHKNGGSFMEAPYLDQHGELPVESKRSNTLHLMKPRYNGLIKNIWLSHNIPNYIVRKLDHVIDAGGWDTL